MTMKQSNNVERKKHILGIVVDEYIHQLNPVSSGFITRKYNLNVSSATIRNILAELESDGLLTHPHTSAGRVPTEEGYRYYVDHLMSEIALLEDQKKQIKAECARAKKDLDLLLEKTSEVLSDLTHYTGIVSVQTLDGRIFCKGTRYVVEYLDYQDIQKIRELLALLEHKGRILELINRKLRQKVQVFIGHEMACRNVMDCSMAVSSYELRDGTTGRIAVLGPKRMDYKKVISALDYLSDLMQEIF